MIRGQLRYPAPSRSSSATRSFLEISFSIAPDIEWHRPRPYSPVIVAGGRAVDALRSITVAQHLFGIQNIVVVHHSHCGATSFTADGIIEAYEQEHHLNISNLYPRSSICITDYEASLKHDTALIRSHKGTPRHVNIFGYFYDIDTRTLTEVIQDIHKA